MHAVWTGIMHTTHLNEFCEHSPHLWAYKKELAINVVTHVELLLDYTMSYVFPPHLHTEWSNSIKCIKWQCCLHPMPHACCVDWHHVQYPLGLVLWTLTSSVGMHERTIHKYHLALLLCYVKIMYFPSSAYRMVKQLCTMPAGRVMWM